MRPSDSEQDIVWKLEIPDVEGFYWVRDFGAKTQQLIRVFKKEGRFYVGRRVMGYSMTGGLDMYRKINYGKVAYCGPDLAPPVV